MEATRVVCEVFFLIEDGNFGLCEDKKKAISREKGPEAYREGEALDSAWVRRWRSRKTDEALEFGGVSGPENEQIGRDLSKFTLLEATYGIWKCKCSAKSW